jgi:NAD+ kinase
MKAVQRVLCLADGQKAAALEFLERLVVNLERRGLAVESLRSVRALEEGAPVQRPDLVLVLGGDGAMLGAVRAFSNDPVPILGINFGYLGFLAGTPSSCAFEVLDHVLAGETEPELRMRLVAEFDGGQRAVALNDVVLQRGSHQGLLISSLSVGDEWVTNLRGDGVIVATPSGSTAYSLAAGGPVIEPSMRCFVVTPLAAQGLANRPIVLDPEAELELEVVQSVGISTLVVDGQGFYPLDRGARVRIRRHPEPYPLFSMPDLDPYRRLRERLGWSSVMPGSARGGEPESAPPASSGGAREGCY